MSYAAAVSISSTENWIFVSTLSTILCEFALAKNIGVLTASPAGNADGPLAVIKLAKPFRGYQYWHNYSESQLNTLKNWIIYCANKYDIDPRVGLVQWVKEKGADGFDVLDLAKANSTPGLYTHTNVIRGKVDMFPQQELIDMLLSL